MVQPVGTGRKQTFVRMWRVRKTKQLFNKSNRNYRCYNVIILIKGYETSLTSFYLFFQLIPKKSNSHQISSSVDSEEDIFREPSSPKRYSERQMGYRLQNLRRRIHRFDMSNLPYIVNLRKIMLLLCLTTAIVVSPTIFIPLAKIQVKFFPFSNYYSFHWISKLIIT